MRFVRFAAAALVIVAAPAALVGCEDTPPPVPRAAFAVSFQDTGVDCDDNSHNGAVGTVNDRSNSVLLNDGDEGVTITCEVSGDGSFAVTGKILKTGTGSSVLDVRIPGIVPGQTKEAPATGTVGYAASGTGGEVYSGSCNFYFVAGTPEGVDKGKFWAAFACPEVKNELSTCAISSGYVIFENCSTGEDEEEEE